MPFHSITTINMKTGFTEYLIYSSVFAKKHSVLLASTRGRRNGDENEFWPLLHEVSPEFGKACSLLPPPPPSPGPSTANSTLCTQSAP